MIIPMRNIRAIDSWNALWNIVREKSRQIHLEVNDFSDFVIEIVGSGKRRKTTS